MSIRPDFKEYKDKVVDLLEEYNFSYVIIPFGIDTVIEITKNNMKEGFLYQESTYRCAVVIMATVMGAAKQLEEINKQIDNNTILGLVDTKGLKVQ